MVGVSKNKGKNFPFDYQRVTKGRKTSSRSLGVQARPSTACFKKIYIFSYGKIRFCGRFSESRVMLCNTFTHFFAPKRLLVANIFLFLQQKHFFIAL